MTWATWVVYTKEVKDNLRDRRSLALALVYPLLGPVILGFLVALTSAMFQTAKENANPDQYVAVAQLSQAPSLRAFLEKKELDVIHTPYKVERAIHTGLAKAVIFVPDNFETRMRTAMAEGTTPPALEVAADTSKIAGMRALQRLTALLVEYQGYVSQKTLAAMGVSASYGMPLTVTTKNVAPRTSISDYFMYMIPPFIIFTLFLGGVYLAIDTTSGERERGSLEPLLANPVARWELMTGKFLAALTFTFLAMLVQLVAFKVSFYFAGSEHVDVGTRLDFRTIAGLLVTCLPLMMMATVIQIIIAAITQSFKEAQTYLGFLPLLPAIPGIMLIFSDVKISYFSMMLPAFSQTQLMHKFVRGEVVYFDYFVVSFISTTLVVLVLMLICARLYEREALLMGR
jgi:sodium transport system permease protein